MGIKSSCRDSGQREKINLNFDSLYGALKDFMNQKVFLSTTKKCENKNVSYFYFNTTFWDTHDGKGSEKLIGDWCWACTNMHAYH